MTEVSRLRGSFSPEARPEVAPSGAEAPASRNKAERPADPGVDALAAAVARALQDARQDELGAVLRRVDALQETVTVLSRTVAQLAATTAAANADTAHKLGALQSHSDVIGHIIEQVRDTVRRKPLVPPALAGAVQRKFLPVKRLARAAARPGAIAARMKVIMNEAARTSERPVRVAGGRWKSRVDPGVWSTTVGRAMRAWAETKAPPLYTVNQRHPTVAGRRPKILHAIPNVFVGGSTQLIVDLFDHIGHKYEMHIMTSAFPPGGGHKGMIIHDLREPTSPEAMANLMRNFGADIVHVHYWGDCDLPWYEKVFTAAAQAGLPVIENLNTPVEPYVDGGVSQYIYVSEYIREAFSTGTDLERVIYPGIDLAAFDKPTKMSKHAADSIGMVYRLERDKLNEESIEPLILVALRRPQTRIFIIGDGSLFEPFKARTIEAGVRDNFVFTGYVRYDELPKYYSEFSVFVAPVWKESFGQVTPFAMSMGLAVGGNKVGALPEILGTDDTLGSSVEETAERLLALLNDPVRRAALGVRNREIALSKYAVETMCAGYDRAYRDALGLYDEDLMPGYPPAEIFTT